MANFKRKITLWLNDEVVSMEDILDAASDATSGNPNDMIVGEERGSFEQFCNCGEGNCPNRNPAEATQ